MKQSDIEADLSLLSKCDFIRATLKGDSLFLQVVADQDEEEEDDEEDDDDDCCCGMNGHLFTIIFQGVKDFEKTEEEYDSYKTEKIIVSKDSIFWNMQGMNLYENGGEYSLSFSYSSFEVIDDGKIEAAEV